MTYIRCGVNQCDVYYTEILLGQLYVGSLYTLNQGGEEADFCPVRITGSSVQNLVYYLSKCEGSSTVDIFYSVMGYRKSDLWKIEELPEEVASAEDLDLRIYYPGVFKPPEPEPEPDFFYP